MNVSANLWSIHSRSRADLDLIHPTSRFDLDRIHPGHVLTLWLRLSIPIFDVGRTDLGSRVDLRPTASIQGHGSTVISSIQGQVQISKTRVNFERIDPTSHADLYASIQNKGRTLITSALHIATWNILNAPDFRSGVADKMEYQMSAAGSFTHDG